MTAQVHEKLLLEGKMTSMAFCPPIPDNHPQILKRGHEDWNKDSDDDPDARFVFSTACWRGYVGTWELKDGKFYLVHITGGYKILEPKPIFADWVTAVLRIPEGKMLHYVHMGFGSVYEFERHIKIENGLVLEERIIDNREKDIDPNELGWKNLPGGENSFDGDEL